MEILAKSPWSPVFVQFMGGWWKAKGLPANLTCPDGAMGKPPKRDFDDLSGGGAVFPFFFWVNRFMVGAGSSYRWDHNPFTSRVVTPLTTFKTPFIGDITTFIAGSGAHLVCFTNDTIALPSSIKKPFKIHLLTNIFQETNIWMFPKIVGFPPNHPILIGFSIINHPFWGTPLVGNTHLWPLGKAKQIMNSKVPGCMGVVWMIYARYPGGYLAIVTSEQWKNQKRFILLHIGGQFIYNTTHLLQGL